MNIKIFWYKDLVITNLFYSNNQIYYKVTSSSFGHFDSFPVHIDCYTQDFGIVFLLVFNPNNILIVEPLQKKIFGNKQKVIAAQWKMRNRKFPKYKHKRRETKSTTPWMEWLLVIALAEVAIEQL